MIKELSIDWMIDWLIGWLIDWLIDWFIDWLIDWFCIALWTLHYSWYDPVAQDTFAFCQRIIALKGSMLLCCCFQRARKKVGEKVLMFFQLSIACPAWASSPHINFFSHLGKGTKLVAWKIHISLDFKFRIFQREKCASSKWINVNR